MPHLVCINLDPPPLVANERTFAYISKVTPKLSLAHLTVIQASPPELVRIAASAGYDCVGLRLLEVTPGDAWPILREPTLLRETKTSLADHGLDVLDVELVRLLPETAVESFEAMLEVAAELGARHVLAQGHDPDWARLVDNFSAFCGLAETYGMTADVEFLTWTGMKSASQAWSLIRDAGHANAGVMIDTLHFSRSGCSLTELDEIPAERFHFVQVSDAAGPVPETTERLIFTAREDRLNPGDGDLDLAAILSRLPENIPVSVEIPNSSLAKVMPAIERVGAARVATLDLLSEVERERVSHSPAR